MPPIVNAQEITKAFGANPLFQNVSFTISDGDRIGLIGPNGSGKSTLLRILAGEVTPDCGEVSFRKRTRLACVEQDSRFESGTTVRSVIESALDRSGVSGSERGARLAETLGRAGFEDLEAQAIELSGGWQKRLAIVEALVQHPDILLLDEPTNHLDLPGMPTRILEEPSSLFQTAAGVEQLLLARNLNAHAEVVVRFQILRNHVGEVMNVDNHLVNSEFAQAGERDLQQRVAAYFHQRFGTIVGKRPQSRAEAGR